MAHLIVAGGTQSPVLLPHASRQAIKMGEINMKPYGFDALTDTFNGCHMRITAENIAEKLILHVKNKINLPLNLRKKY